MAKSVVILASALCFFSLLGFAYCENIRLFVEGSVYCDTCRTQFVTKISVFMQGATVRLECRDREGGHITFSSEATTDANGAYRIVVDGDREEEVCEVGLLKSSDPDCSELSKDPFNKKSARVSLTKNNGMSNPVRLANPLGFLKKKPVSDECAGVLRELGMSASDIV